MDAIGARPAGTTQDETAGGEPNQAGVPGSMGTASYVVEGLGNRKDVDQVMRDARDLVRIRHTLRQVVSVKGD